MEERMNALVIGCNSQMTDHMAGVVDSHPITGKTTQHTQVAHWHTAQAHRLIEECVNCRHWTHASRLRRASYGPIVVDRMDLCVSSAQRANVDHATLACP